MQQGWWFQKKVVCHQYLLLQAVICVVTHTVAFSLQKSIPTQFIRPAGQILRVQKTDGKERLPWSRLKTRKRCKLKAVQIHGCCLLNQRKCNLTQDTPKVIEFVLNANIEGKLSSPSNFVNSRFRKLSNMFLPVATSWSGFCHSLILMFQAEHRLQRGTFAVPTSDSTWNHHLLG